MKHYLTSCLIVAGLTASATEKSSRLVIVFNRSDAPGEIVSQALRCARRIFSNAGLETSWRVAGPNDSVPAYALTVQIVRRHGSLMRLEHLGSTLLSADASPSPSSVYYGLIEDRTSVRLDAPTLLAHVMAHEVGHQLLGAEHTSNTIMTATWGKEEYSRMPFGLLRFSADQARQLQVAWDARMRVETQGR